MLQKILTGTIGEEMINPELNDDSFSRNRKILQKVTRRTINQLLNGQCILNNARINLALV